MKYMIPVFLKKSASVVVLIALAVTGLFFLVILSAFVQGRPYVPYFVNQTCPALDNPCEISVSKTATAVYSTLSEVGESDIFAIELESGEGIALDLIVPSKILSEIRDPVIAIVGPGLPTQEKEYDFLQQPNINGVIEFQEDKREAINNSLTLKKWISVQDMEFEAPSSDTYYIVVFDEVGEPGEYALYFHGSDPLRPGELIRLVFGTLRLNLGLY